MQCTFGRSFGLNRTNYNFPFIHSKLINVLLTHIHNAINNKTTGSDLESFGSVRENSSERVLYKTTKNLQYIMKFVIRSRILFANLNDNRDHHLFEASLESEPEFFILPTHLTDHLLI